MDATNNAVSAPVNGPLILGNNITLTGQPDGSIKVDAAPVIQPQAAMPEVVRRAIDLLEAVEGTHAPARCAKLRAAIEAYEAAPPSPQLVADSVKPPLDMEKLLSDHFEYAQNRDGDWYRGYGAALHWIKKAISDHNNPEDEK